MRSPAAAAAALAAAVAALLLAAATAVIDSNQTPEYIKPCNRTDPKIEDCIRSSFNHLRPYLQKGIPELQLPPLEPMRVDNLAMENGNGAVRVRAVFSDVDVRGASNYTVEGVKADILVLGQLVGESESHLPFTKEVRVQIPDNLMFTLFPQNELDYFTGATPTVCMEGGRVGVPHRDDAGPAAHRDRRPLRGVGQRAALPGAQPRRLLGRLPQRDGGGAHPGPRDRQQRHQRHEGGAPHRRLHAGQGALPRQGPAQRQQRARRGDEPVPEPELGGDRGGDEACSDAEHRAPLQVLPQRRLHAGAHHRLAVGLTAPPLPALPCFSFRKTRLRNKSQPQRQSNVTFVINYLEI